MTTRSEWLGRTLLWIFVLSGFAGLIYQSIWSHYLGLVLGHAAYAQCLVLAIFMGGMSLGAWLAARWSADWHRLVRAYAVIELIIGVIGIAFHAVFVGYMDLSQNHVLPSLESAWTAHAYQWLSAALLIAPQCVLLGMTFPLLSAGYLRLAPNDDGRVLGGLYFTNSIGAAAGALVCTFVLLPAIGMPGATLTAGLLNILVALIAWPVGRAAEAAEQPRPAPQEAARAAKTAAEVAPLARVLFAAAAITGATSFVYEIGWVRLLNQSLGTTVHSFELMLAAFIAGLAFGGNWIRKRGRDITNPLIYAGGAQIAMGVAALLSIPVFAHSFDGVAWMMRALSRTDEGYALFSLGGAVVSVLVMFPAAFFAGMTLPLFTISLLRKGAGESAIGRIYAFNTLGAIIGVFLMIQVLIPLLGIRLAVILSALVDIALGMYLLRGWSGAGWRRPALLASCVVALVLTAFLGRIDPAQQISGVFRTGHNHYNNIAHIPYLRDGKTATVGVAKLNNGVAMIATNGKPDAGLTVSLKEPPQQDELTMLMTGALPLFLHPRPLTAGIIGWGSGLSTHTLLGNPDLKSVETIEIERAMVDGAKLFGERVERAYADPRSHIVIDDARTYFSTKARKYDVILSEPSNPWVSGVASLFTREFYGFLRGHLNEQGILVQWIQTYELNDALLATMLAALTEQFPYVEAYLTNTSDMLFVASVTPLGQPNWSALQHEPLLSELRRVGLGSADEFKLRRVGNRDVLRNLAKMYGAPPHSDFFPTVSLQAPKSRFMDQRATALSEIAANGLPVLDFLAGQMPLPENTDIELNPFSPYSAKHRLGRETVRSLRGGAATAELVSRSTAVATSVDALVKLSADPVVDSDEWLQRWSLESGVVAASSLGVLPAADMGGAWIDAAWAKNLSGWPRQVMSVYEAAARRDAAALLPAAVAALDSAPAVAVAMQREQMLILAQLGAIAQGKHAQALELGLKHGMNLPPSPFYGPLRSFLMSWADR